MDCLVVFQRQGNGMVMVTDLKFPPPVVDGLMTLLLDPQSSGANLIFGESEYRILKLRGKCTCLECLRLF